MESNNSNSLAIMSAGLDFTKKYFYLDQSLVKNEDLLSKIKDIVTCTICLGILINPKMCVKCEISFCDACIDQWCVLKNECPFRCSSSTFVDPPRILRKNLDLLELECPNDCERTFRYSELIPHLSTCDGKVECWNCKCKAKRKDFKYGDQLIYQTELERNFLTMKFQYESLKKEYEEFKVTSQQQQNDLMYRNYVQIGNNHDPEFSIVEENRLHVSEHRVGQEEIPQAPNEYDPNPLDDFGFIQSSQSNTGFCNHCNEIVQPFNLMCPGCLTILI
jgi:hypothetical protein